MVYPDLYKHSIYFEILSVDSYGQPGTVLESFAFSMPPTNIEIVDVQRVTSTATPGGFFVDNYGQGAAKITISGETGNEDSRLTILGPGKTPKYLTGQESYFEFKKRIVDFSQRSNNYTMRFYDLTNKGTVNIFRKNALSKVSRYTEAWEVVLDESSLRRSNVKPMFYPYSISLTGVRKLGTFNPRLAKNEVGFLSSVRDKIDSVTDAVSAFNANLDLFLSNSFEYLSDITDILSSTNDLLSQMTVFTGLFTEYEQKLGGLFEDVISETSDALSTGIQVISFPFDAMEIAKDKIDIIKGKTSALLTMAKTDGKDALDVYDWDSDIDIVSTISLSETEIIVSFNNIELIAKQGSSYDPVGAIAVSGVVVPIYGYSTYDVKENTRLDRVAVEIFGDVSYKDVLSGINEIYSNDELVQGTVLKIPLLVADTRYSNNAVYNTPENKDDVLGKDAVISSDGVFLTDLSDYITTSGDDTVLQAVSLNIAEKRGRQLLNGTYGLIFAIGSALNNDSPFEVLSVSLSESLMQDPRITNVYDLNFISDGDKIYQVFKYDTIAKTEIIYKEGM